MTEPDILEALTELAEAKPGGPMPKCLAEHTVSKRVGEWATDPESGVSVGLAVNEWGTALSAIAARAKAEIERLRLQTIYHQWQPIETAPVENWMTAPSGYRFECMLQWLNHAGEDVTGEGYCKYVAAPRSTMRNIPRWHYRGGLIRKPKYWMPLPAPHKEPGQ